MAFKKIGKALKRVAPYAASIAGTAIGGPVGGQIVKALGLSPDASDEDVERVLAANDPTQIAALRKIEADAKAAILQSETDRLRIDADDRDSARKREIAIKDRTPQVLAYSVIGGFVGLLAMLVFKAVPEPSEKIVAAMVGSLGTVTTQIASYYFGSSAGSARKDSHMAAALKRDS